MSSTPEWANALMGAGGAATVLWPLTAWASRRFKRNVREVASEVVEEKLEPNNKATQDINERVIRIEAQFGPNGGGLRQAVNELSVSVAELRGEFRAAKTQQTR